jgi:hypothetical protein
VTVRIEWPQSKKELKRIARKPARKHRRRVKREPRPMTLTPWQREMNARALASLDRAGQIEAEERERRMRAFPEPPIVYPAHERTMRPNLAGSPHSSSEDAL